MLSRQSKSFFLVILISLLCLYAALVATREILPSLSGISLNTNNQGTGLRSNKADANTPSQIDTTTWPTYADTKFNFAVKYPPNWKVTTGTENGFYTVSTAPPQQKGIIFVYVSSKEFLGFEGLPSRDETINGYPAIVISDLLVGIKHNNNYYTFDVGTNTLLQPQFMAMVKTIQFK